MTDLSASLTGLKPVNVAPCDRSEGLAVPRDSDPRAAYGPHNLSIRMSRFDHALYRKPFVVIEMAVASIHEGDGGDK